MINYERLGALALVFAIGACGEARDSSTDKGAEPPTREEVVSRAGDLARPEPGLYRSSVEILEVDIPGAPPQAADMIRQSGTMSQASEYCLTPAEVEKGFEEAVRKSQRGDCDYERFDVDGNRIEAAMICREQGRAVRMTLSGNGDRTSSEMVMTMTMDMPGMGEATIRATSRSQRVGDCPG